MASSNNRLKIVQLAVAQAGRGPELYSHAKDLLNVMLRSWAIKDQYKQLRKVGSSLTLSSGSRTVTLPADFGFGMDSLVLDESNIPLKECDLDEFVAIGGFASTVQRNTGCPTAYFIDKEAGLIRFNNQADRDYSVLPVYFKLPEDIPLTGAGDNQQIWFDDDDTAIQGLVEQIYQFTTDDRENGQGQRVLGKKAEFRRGTSTQSGGGSGMNLNRGWFKARRR